MVVAVVVRVTWLGNDCCDQSTLLRVVRLVVEDCVGEDESLYRHANDGGATTTVARRRGWQQP